jgi:hypothetical protein
MAQWPVTSAVMIGWDSLGKSSKYFMLKSLAIRKTSAMV